MIHFTLDSILNELQMSRNQFSQCCGVRPNTVNDMCKGNTKRIEIETLSAILACLNEISHRKIDISDIMFYEADIDKGE